MRCERNFIHKRIQNVAKSLWRWLLKTSTFEWFKKFQEGRESVEDDSRSGRPSTSMDDAHIEKVKELMLENSQLTARDNRWSWNIIWIVPTHFVQCTGHETGRFAIPKNLNFLQKENRVFVSSEMISTVPETAHTRIITGDEAWVYQYETKQQSLEWRLKNETRPKRTRRLQSKVKVMLTVFFDHCGVVHQEFLPTGQKVNGLLVCHEAFAWSNP